MKTLRIVAILMTAVVLTACGPTRRQVIEDYTDEFAAMREHLQTIARGLPAPGDIGDTTSCAELDRPLVIDRENDEYTGAILGFEQLLDPDVGEPLPTGLDLDVQFEIDLDTALGGDLLRALRWTGPKSPLHRTELNKTAPSAFRQAFENALALEYVVVERVTAYESSIVNSAENRFYPGHAVVGILVVSLKTGEVLCSDTFVAEPQAEQIRCDPGVGHYSIDCYDKLRAALWADARDKLEASLQEITGGTIVFD